MVVFLLSIAMLVFPGVAGMTYQNKYVLVCHVLGFVQAS